LNFVSPKFEFCRTFGVHLIWRLDGHFDLNLTLHINFITEKIKFKQLVEEKSVEQKNEKIIGCILRVEAIVNEVLVPEPKKEETCK